LAKVFARVFTTSKIPNVTCFGYESTLKNLITTASLSCNPFDIQRSTLSIAKLHFAKTNKTYNCLVFFYQGNISCENYFLEAKISLGHLNVNIGVSSTNFQQIAWADDC
jgi:hypothetical protein